MAKLQFSHQTVRKSPANHRQVQELLIEVDYDPQEGGIYTYEVWLMQDGKYIAEISKLLDQAEGDPMTTMIEAINWDEMYRDQITERIAA